MAGVDDIEVIPAWEVFNVDSNKAENETPLLKAGVECFVFGEDVLKWFSARQNYYQVVMVINTSDPAVSAKL